ncbi:hypothetical protein [Desulfovibrio aminophilus]|uniref:hypothetical protein n=1 Tax=Desulfovibrio aminophilus TaxID=81425 RepID=UPI0004820088|nr:hypothetical protein [Desulfovibrio aminophilus]
MIQFLADNIDQLDLALDQLAIADRNFDRFAFMLIDNVVELTLHKFAQDKAGENEMWGRWGEPKHDQKVIKEALSQNFDCKVKAAGKLGLLNKAISESILNLHSYRNTAYHKGLRHEGILHSLALFYFRNACTLLAAYEPVWWSWSSSDKPSHRAQKYLGDPRRGDYRKVFEFAYARLDSVAASMHEDLVGDLSEDLSKTIDSIDETIDFLVDGGPKKKNRDDVIIDCQVWPFAFTDDAKAYAKANGCKETTVGGFLDWITKNYPWPLRKDPVSGWRKRLATLRREKNRHNVLKIYCDFMRQTEKIRAQIVEAAAQLDAYIQQQIDVARGK